MCQPKSKGGKRCDSHLRGSSATVNTTTILTGESREEVTKAFRDLRKEGKKLEKPTPEMVRAFAESQRFQAAFNPDLTDAQRKRISNHWEAAAQEEPSGATFHAWKHTLFEVMRRARAKVAAVFVAGVISVSLASCSTGGTLNEENTPPPSPSAVPSATVEAPSHTKEEIELNEYGIYVDGNSKLGITATGPEFTDSYGTYNRVSVEDDALVMEPTVDAYQQDALNAWGEDKLIAGEKVSKRFILEQMMDNQAIYDSTPESMKAYLDESSEFVSPEWRDSWTGADTSQGYLGAGLTDPSVPMYTKAKDATFPEYEPGQARYSLNNMTLKSVEENPDIPGDVIYKYEMGIQRPANIRTGENEYTKGFIFVQQDRWLSLRPTSDGKFEIAGWYAETKAFPHDSDGTQLNLYSLKD